MNRWKGEKCQTKNVDVVAVAVDDGEEEEKWNYWN